jgi:membrane dipeptidase
VTGIEHAVESRAAGIHRNSVIVEGHRDCYELLHWLSRGEVNPLRDRMMPRLREGGVDLVVYAVGGDSLAHSAGRDKRLLATLENISAFSRAVDEQGSGMRIVRNAGDLPSRPDGVVRFMLHIEGGGPLEGSLAALEALHRLGVRSMQPTWNLRNELADGVHERGADSGLTRFGAAAVRLAEEMGMVIDLAHLSEAGFWDCLRKTSGPVLVSHANSKTVYDHPRNLTDDQAKAVAERGGVVGVMAIPAIVGEGSPTVEHVVDHAEHLCSLIGVEHVSFGADYVKEDGPRPSREQLFVDPLDEVHTVQGLSEADETRNLTRALINRGFTDHEVSAVMGGNALRVFARSLPDG